MNDAQPLRIVLVDDSEVVRMKLRAILNTGGLKVVGEAGDAEVGEELVRALEPDVVVMDLQMPGMSGIEATWRLGTVAPASKVLMLTVSAEQDDLADAIMAGAAGYVVKGGGDDEICDAVRAVAAGQRVISPGIAHELVERSGGAPAASSRTPLGRASAPPAPEPSPPEPAPAPPEGPVVAARGPRTRILWTVVVVLAAGIVLTAFNQAETILDGNASLATWAKVALNFLVPLGVWTLGASLGRPR